MLKQIVAKKPRENRFYEDHQQTVWNHMRPEWLVTDWMMIMVMTVIMRMTLMMIANMEVLDT